MTLIFGREGKPAPSERLGIYEGGRGNTEMVPNEKLRPWELRSVSV